MEDWKKLKRLEKIQHLQIVWEREKEEEKTNEEERMEREKNEKENYMKQ